MLYRVSFWTSWIWFIWIYRRTQGTHPHVKPKDTELLYKQTLMPLMIARRWNVQIKYFFPPTSQTLSSYALFKNLTWFQLTCWLVTRRSFWKYHHCSWLLVLMFGHIWCIHHVLFFLLSVSRWRSGFHVLVWILRWFLSLPWVCLSGKVLVYSSDAVCLFGLCFLTLVSAEILMRWVIELNTNYMLCLILGLQPSTFVICSNKH